METNSYAEEWRCKSMAYSGPPRLTVYLSMEGGKGQVAHAENQGRPDPQPQGAPEKMLCRSVT